MMFAARLLHWALGVVENMHNHILRDEALSIWRRGVAAVNSQRLVAQSISAWQNGLLICGVPWRAQRDSRICVVGGGKAGAGMVQGVQQALGDRWLSRTHGWVNVPDNCRSAEDDIPATSSPIHLHAARPGGVNEPTAAGVAGTEEILAQVGTLGPDDLCLVLISGGGSALLPAPLPGISLADKQLVTRTLSRAGATIDELNCVRRALSLIKGGGLLQACGAGTMIALIISDVAGDPLETIASGPTVRIPKDPAAAWKIVQRGFQLAGVTIPNAVSHLLLEPVPAEQTHVAGPARAHNFVIGNNRTAVEAARQEALRLGWTVVSADWDQAGEAAQVGQQFARQLKDMMEDSTPRTCFISGGEPIVHVQPQPGSQRGGRNQELILAALCELLPCKVGEFALVSGGTDGEDGPTDAAGAWLDSAALAEVVGSGDDPLAPLRRHDSYPFLERHGLLLKTGPTQTNVMDLRVGLALGSG